MISVIIPTLNAEATLPRCLNGLLEAAMSGLVREVIIVDGGSTDETLAIADAAGTQIISGPKSRGARLSQGAAAARFDWLLFLHANTVLEPSWVHEAASFMERALPEKPRAAVFGFALDDFEPSARRREFFVALRCWFLGLPTGDQGLLIPARLYRQLGGYKALPAMEDIDFVRRLGRRRLITLRARAVSSIAQNSASTFQRMHRFALLLLHALRVPAPLVSRLYG